MSVDRDQYVFRGTRERFSRLKEIAAFLILNLPLSCPANNRFVRSALRGSREHGEWCCANKGGTAGKASPRPLTGWREAFFYGRNKT